MRRDGLAEIVGGSSAAPPQPESFEITMANRSSWAPAQRAVLPSREWPITAIVVASSRIVGFEVVHGAGTAPRPRRRWRPQSPGANGWPAG